MKTITYTNNQGLELKINKFSSGQFKWAFSLTFNNGVHTFCYTMTELRTILLKNGIISTCYTQEELQDFLQRNNFQKC